MQENLTRLEGGENKLSNLKKGYSGLLKKIAWATQLAYLVRLLQVINFFPKTEGRAWKNRPSKTTQDLYHSEIDKRSVVLIVVNGSMTCMYTPV